MKYINSLLAAVVLGFTLLGTAHAEVVEGAAPDFALKSRNSGNLKLSEYRGDVVMINFWASWCAPCRQEMPLLNDLYEKYSDLGFTLLGVNVEEDSSKADELLKDVPVTFPILFDNKNEVTKMYNVVAMPTTVIVDRDGNMRYLHRGYLPGYEEEYKKQVKELIRE
jgi:peroxiredoxin